MMEDFIKQDCEGELFRRQTKRNVPLLSHCVRARVCAGVSVSAYTHLCRYIPYRVAPLNIDVNTQKHKI